MAIALSQAALADVTSGTSLADTITTSAGSLIVAVCVQGLNNTDTLSITDSASQTGWTQTASGYTTPDATHKAGIFYRANSAALTSVTCTKSGAVGRISMVVCEITGAATASPEDSSVNHTDVSGTTSNSGSLTTTNANDLLLDAAFVSGAFTVPTAGAGYTIPTNGSSLRVIVQSKVVSTTQSAVTTSITWTTAAVSGNIFVGFKAAASGFTWQQLTATEQPLASKPEIVSY